MSEQDVDDVAFLTGDSSAGLHRRNFYERANEVVRCSERKTYCVLCICCMVLLITSLIIALAPLRNGCICSEADSNKITDDEWDGVPRMENGEGFVNCWAPDIKHRSKFEYQYRINNIIMRENRIMLKKIHQAESQYPMREFLNNWKRLRELVEHHSRYISEMEKLSLLDVQKQLSEKSRMRCFFDIGLKNENQKLGRIVFELYDSVVPRTCENFAAFCRGVNGLSYKHTPFHRIVSGYWCQGGDVTKFDGTGGTSIYGDSFDKENSNLRHIGPGILSTCNTDDGRNNSKFNLTFKCLKTVDEDKTVFGRVIQGLTNIYKGTSFC